MENNNDNLFTNMFGVESEEPSVQPVEQPVAEPTPVPVVPPTPIPPQQPVTMEQPIQNQPVNQEIIVLDSNKPQEPEPVPVQPQEPTPKLNSMNYTAKPVTPLDYQEMDKFAPAKETNYKVICIVLVVTLVAVIGAFFLYTGLDTYLENNSSNNNEQSEQKPVDDNKQEEPKVPTTPIVFDMDLSFDKGYTTKTHELHQTQAYKPEASEGVIKCETIRRLSDPNIGTAKEIVYIYYKDYMTKKLLTINEWSLINSKIYNEYLIGLQTINSALSANEHLYTQILVDKTNYLIDYYMLVDLAYNQATKIPNSNYYIDVKLSYNAAIKNAMNKFLLDQRYSGNMYCSTLETSQASI